MPPGGYHGDMPPNHHRHPEDMHRMEGPYQGRTYPLPHHDMPPQGRESISPEMGDMGRRRDGQPYPSGPDDTNPPLDATERRPERLMRGHGMPPGAPPRDSYEPHPGHPYRERGDRGDRGGVNSGDRGSDRGSSRRLNRDEFTELDQFAEWSSSRQHLDPSSAVGKNRSRRKLDPSLRNDSLSSDPSDCVRPPPPKPHKHRRGKQKRQASLSSSEDEIQTTPECTSCDEHEIESESVSEKGMCFSSCVVVL